MLKKTKIFFTGFLLLCVFSLLMPIVAAQTEYIITQFTGVSGTYKITYPYTQNASAINGNTAGLYETFSPSASNRYFSSAGFCLYKVGSPIGLIQALLLNNATGALIELSSTELQASTLTTNAGGSWYNFTFAATNQVVVGTVYRIEIRIFSADQLDVSNYVCVRSGNGDESQYTYSLWGGNWAAALADIGFIVKGFDVSGATPTPPPTATATPSGDGITDTVNALTSNILAFIALALILIPAVIGAKFAGGWGFLAGLNVGVGLVFIFSVISGSLWFVVMIGIVDAVAVIRGMSGSGKAETVTKGE